MTPGEGAETCHIAFYIIPHT